jgi:hypothetical protein
MALTTFSKDFKSTLQKFLPVNCGIPESLRNSVSSQYIVHLKSTNKQAGAEAGNTGESKVEVWGYLQDKIEVNIKADWEGVSEIFGGIDKMADTILQAATTWLPGSSKTGSRSLVSQASSRRKWTGSSPISIVLPLRFEAIDNVHSEVLQPCMALQQLCAPREGDLTKGFFLIPPGPSPFKVGESQEVGDLTSITIGNFFYLESVIINDVSITYETRMSSIGPIGATAKVTLSAYEIPTKQSIAKMYNQMGITQSMSMDKALGKLPDPSKMVDVKILSVNP